jgi:hypothetical protein
MNTDKAVEINQLTEKVYENALALELRKLRGQPG